MIRTNEVWKRLFYNIITSSESQILGKMLFSPLVIIKLNHKRCSLWQTLTLYDKVAFFLIRHWDDSSMNSVQWPIQLGDY